MKSERYCAPGVGRLFVLLLGAALLSACVSIPDPVTSEQRSLLAPSGALKVGLYPGTPTAILINEDGSAPRGVGYELGQALAQRLGVTFEPVVLPKNADVLEAIKSGKVDVAFTNATATRAKNMDFTRPYLEIEMGYLVPAGSSLKSIDEIDRQGIRVAVTTNSTSDEVLTRSLKNASVVRANTLKIGLAWLAEGQAEAYATNKATLFEMADELPGAQVLKGYWGVERHAIAIPKGREAGLPVVQKFSEEVRASGLVVAAAKRAGLRGVLEAGSQ